MRAHLRSIVLASAVLLAPAAAHATAFNVVNVQYQVVQCKGVQAATPNAAYIQCLNRIVTTRAEHVVMQAAPTCRSTHRIQPQNGTPAKWGYDKRFFVPRPECP